jgi:hypothetical protein
MENELVFETVRVFVGAGCVGSSVAVAGISVAVAGIFVAVGTVVRTIRVGVRVAGWVEMVVAKTRVGTRVKGAGAVGAGAAHALNKPSINPSKAFTYIF